MDARLVRAVLAGAAVPPDDADDVISAALGIDFTPGLRSWIASAVPFVKAAVKDSNLLTTPGLSQEVLSNLGAINANRIAADNKRTHVGDAKPAPLVVHPFLQRVDIICSGVFEQHKSEAIGPFVVCFLTAIIFAAHDHYKLVALADPENTLALMEGLYDHIVMRARAQGRSLISFPWPRAFPDSNTGAAAAAPGEAAPLAAVMAAPVRRPGVDGHSPVLLGVDPGNMRWFSHPLGRVKREVSHLEIARAVCSTVFSCSRCSVVDVRADSWCTIVVLGVLHITSSRQGDELGPGSTAEDVAAWAKPAYSRTKHMVAGFAEAALAQPGNLPVADLRKNITHYRKARPIVTKDWSEASAIAMHFGAPLVIVNLTTAEGSENGKAEIGFVMPEGPADSALAVIYTTKDGADSGHTALLRGPRAM